MADSADVIIHWYSDSPELQAVVSKFKRPTRFVGMPAGPGTSYKDQAAKYWPYVIRSICQNRFGTSFKPQRVCIIGFSEGCSGLYQTLRSADAKYLDCVIGVDGIFSEWIEGSKKTKLETGYLNPWKAIAKLAAADGRLVIITASSIVPEWVPVSVCADWIWENVVSGWTVDAGGEEKVGPAGLGDIIQGPVLPVFDNPAGCMKSGNSKVCWKNVVYTSYPTKMYRQAGGFIVVDYENLDETGVGDHRLQAARVLPLMVEHFLLPRWNENPPESGIVLA